MTTQSFNARLKKCNPSLRLRKRTGLIVLKAEGYAMCGVFKRNTYLKTATIAGDIPYHSRPRIFRIERMPGQKKATRFVHSEMRRGRWELIQILWGYRAIKHRWQRQLLSV